MKLHEAFAEITPIFSYGGKQVFDTSHSTERYLTRVKGYVDMDMIKSVLFTQMIKRIESLNKSGKLHNDELLVYSKKLRTGVVVAYRDSKTNPTGERNYHIITYLPPGHHTPKGDTPEMQVESVQYQVVYIS